MPCLGFAVSAEDNRTYEEIDLQRKIFVGEVHVFAATLAYQLDIVNSRLKDEDYENLQACYAGFDAKETLEKAKTLQVQCIALKHKVETFKERLLTVYKVRPSAMIIAGLTCFGLAVAGIAAIALHLIPIVNFTLAPVLLSGVVAGSLAAVVAGVAFTAAAGEAAKRLDKAIKFLDDFEGKLKVLRNHLVEVRAHTVPFQNMVKDREECSALLNTLIAECKEIVKVCNTI